MGNPILNLAESVLGRNYRLAKAIYKWKQARQLEKSPGPPILIFNMGKVGSKSVRLSLENRPGLGSQVYHAHYLTRERQREAEAKRKKHFRTSRHAYLRRAWLNEFLLEEYEKSTPEKRWKLVTLTREPVGRNLSTLFENLLLKKLDDGRFEIRSDYYDIDVPIILGIENTDELTRLFMEKVRHDSPLDFFDRELKAVFGIDVYAREFPKAKGYDIYEGRNCDLLLIRLESLNACHQEALAAFLGIPDFRLTDTNIGAEKDYAPLYKSLKEAIVLPEEYLDKLYGSKYTRHFYTEAEIEKFRSKWERKPVV
jgi:hypothetical protein